MAIDKLKKTTIKPEQLMFIAKYFVYTLRSLHAAVQDNARYFKGDSRSNKFLGVRMASVFRQAKHYVQMPHNELEKLLDSD
jgi:hypothetical protein